MNKPWSQEVSGAEFAVKLQDKRKQRLSSDDISEEQYSMSASPPPYYPPRNQGSGPQPVHLVVPSEGAYSNLEVASGHSNLEVTASHSNIEASTDHSNLEVSEPPNVASQLTSPPTPLPPSVTHPASAWKCGVMKLSVPGSIFPHTYFFWLNDNPVPATYLHSFIRKSKAADTSQTVYRATRSGAGLLFYGKAGVDIAAPDYMPVGVVNLSWANEPAWASSSLSTASKTHFAVSIAGKTYSFNIGTKHEREGWVEAFTEAMARGKRWEMEVEMTTKGASNVPLAVNVPYPYGYARYRRFGGG